MKYPTLRFVFDRKHKATKTTTGLVQLEVLSEGRRKWISTGVKLYVDQWSPRRMVINHPEITALNKKLLEQRKKIQTWIETLETNSEEFEFDKLDGFLKARQESRNFIEYVERRIEERKDIRESTRRTQHKLVTSLKRFNQIVYFTDLTKGNI